MRLNPLAVLREHESPVGAEAGVDEVAVEKGPLEPLYKVWSAVGAWPLAVGMMSVAAGVSLPLSLAVPFEKIMPKFPQPIMGAVPLVTLARRKPGHLLLEFQEADEENVRRALPRVKLAHPCRTNQNAGSFSRGETSLWRQRRLPVQ